MHPEMLISASEPGEKKEEGIIREIGPPSYSLVREAQEKSSPKRDFTLQQVFGLKGLILSNHLRPRLATLSF